MSIQEIILRMYPYWFLGLFMLYYTYNSKHRDLLRVDFKAVGKWTVFVCLLGLWRYFALKYLPMPGAITHGLQGVLLIPWQMTLTVFWEDMCHGVPLVLLERFLSKKKIKHSKWIMRLSTLVVMCSFGLGHLYQGMIAALMLSLYIPYSIKIGKEKGFGTVMICHTLFDLTTIISIRMALGMM